VIRFPRTVFFTALSSVVLLGCATNVGLPQTRDEFVAGMKAGGMFRNAETITGGRPLKTVVANVTEYADKCLSVRFTRSANYSTKESGSTTLFRPKVQTTSSGVTALSLQEEYNNTPQSGTPPGGMYTLVSEIRAAAGGKTQVDIYYVTGKSRVAEMLKRWADGDKQRCPSFD
jgi:hypothetical protein